MILESFLTGVKNVLLSDIPGTELNVAAGLGALTVIGGIIYVGRTGINALLGTKI